MAAGILLLFMVSLAWVTAQRSPFMDNLEIVEDEERGPTYSDMDQYEKSEDQPQEKEVSQFVTIRLLEERTVNNLKFRSYTFTLEGEDYVIHLNRSALLMSPNFKVYSYNESKHLQISTPHIQSVCYYQGFIEGYPHSAVALNTCSGLRGTMYTDIFKYAIEPDGPQENVTYILYNTETFETSVECNLDTSMIQRATPDPNITEKINSRKTAYLELFMVASQLQFQFYDENATSLLQGMLELINDVNNVLRPLKTQVVLVGLEIWSGGNLIDTETDSAEDILADFLDWKKEFLDTRYTFDIVGLSLREVNSIGLSRLGGACDPDNSAFVISMNLDKLVFSSAVFVHQLGHLLGMEHDIKECSCGSGNSACAMAAEGKLSTKFSDCSVEDMDSFYASDKASCLWNAPISKAMTVGGQCGNNMLEPGEECDCGTAQKCQNDSCCNHETCMLKPNASCFSGPCCYKCKFVAEGTPCRMPSTECDLAEYCDGRSSSCPPDVYQQNGSPCNNGQSVCFDKRCYDYNEHCKRIFGESSTVGPLSCFQHMNTIGDRFGNCGKIGDLREPIPCDDMNVMCGRIQCLIVERKLPNFRHTSVIATPVDGFQCWGLDSGNQSGFRDLGAVSDGAVCDKGKICLDRKCVDFSEVEYDCDIERKCSGRGVCNNRKNCHCDMSWAPPDCNTSGHGGSVDSGPLVKNSFITYIHRKELPLNTSNMTRCYGLMYILLISMLQYFTKPNA